MFYAGVSASGRQSIGLATSTDLTNWDRRDTPVFTCEQTGWNWCDSTNPNGMNLRDPFVMPDPDSTGRWIMLYSTILADTTAVIGRALSSGDFTAWRDGGPLWRGGTNWWDNNRKAESAHIFGHNNTWFIGYSTESSQTLEFQNGDDPGDSTAWVHWDRIANLDCVNTAGQYASEFFRDDRVGGSGREYYCNVNGDLIEIRQVRW